VYVIYSIENVYSVGKMLILMLLVIDAVSFNP